MTDVNYCLVYMFVTLLFLRMCLHPVSKGRDHFDRTIYSLDESLDEFDSCDYVNGQLNASTDDLCIVQLNVRGISSKQTSLRNMIDNCIANKTPDIIVVCETWLTLFSPRIVIPGYEVCHKDRVSHRGGGVGLLISD